MNRKEIRQITRYTFANQQSDKESWYSSAVSFHEGANVLEKHQDSVHRGISVFLTNAALSIELLLKAIIVAKGGMVPKTHKLSKLAFTAGITFTPNQEATLELLAEVLRWRGRYPIPLYEEDWDHYHDVVFEKHIIRETEGSIRRIRANPETFPSAKNYEVIWNLAKCEWDKIQTPQVTN